MTTTALERLIEKCPEGKWLPEGWRLTKSGTIQKNCPFVRSDGTTPAIELMGWHDVPLDKLTPNFRLAVQGRLAEMNGARGVYVIGNDEDGYAAYELDSFKRTGEMVGTTLTGEREPETFDTYFDAQADAWIAVRGE